MQSSSPSQTNAEEMHSPLVTHLNSCEVHDRGAATKKKVIFEYCSSTDFSHTVIIRALRPEGSVVIVDM